MELCRRCTLTTAVCNPCRETLKSHTKEMLHCTHLFMALLSIKHIYETN
jgi:hypothetical protein